MGSLARLFPPIRGGRAGAPVSPPAQCVRSNHHLRSSVADKTYVIAYVTNRDPSDRSTQELVRGSHVEEEGNQLWFIKEDGSVGAFFDQGRT
jgi:hypothetical protein